MRNATGACRQHEFAALVLFDPPNVPRPGHAVRVKMAEYEHKLAHWARHRRDHFNDPLALANEYASTRSGRRWPGRTAELMARAVLQPDPAGGWALACPKELEASMYLQGIPLGLWPKRRQFAMPVTLIGADPDTPTRPRRACRTAPWPPKAGSITPRSPAPAICCSSRSRKRAPMPPSNFCRRSAFAEA
jgi:hypothetical protein